MQDKIPWRQRSRSFSPDEERSIARGGICQKLSDHKRRCSCLYFSEENLSISSKAMDQTCLSFIFILYNTLILVLIKVTEIQFIIIISLRKNLSLRKFKKLKFQYFPLYFWVYSLVKIKVQFWEGRWPRIKKFRKRKLLSTKFYIRKHLSQIWNMIFYFLTTPNWPRFIDLSVTFRSGSDVDTEAIGPDRLELKDYEDDEDEWAFWDHSSCNNQIEEVYWNSEINTEFLAVNWS